MSISEGELVMNRVFVCGSMSEGMIHFNKIESSIESICNATILAAAYQLPSGYPVALDGGSEAIPGHLVEVKSSEFIIPLLDQFFGYSEFEPQKSLHFRTQVQVQLNDNRAEPVLAWVYFLNPKKLPTAARLIKASEWVEKLHAPKFMDQLTDRQKFYIRKLGQISGREVVPVDLPLYRELMSLELIVDKGRRLALSKFGQEVYRYLGETKL